MQDNHHPVGDWSNDLWILDLGDEDPAQYPEGRPWMAVSAENHAVFFATEEEACALQRHWRQLHGRDPMTGEELTQTKEQAP